MAHKPATPGTGLTGPLYILDKKLDVVGVFDPEAIAAIVVDDTNAESVAASLQDLIDALTGQ